MKKQALAAASMIVAGIMAGCGAGSSTTPAATTAVSGKVADGYLVNATVFLDKNGNYQLDPGEPSAVTDQNGAYTLNISPDDMGKFPIVAVAMAGKTVDKDTGATVSNTYVMTLPSSSVSGAVNGFVSPMSTLVREKMEANPGMTAADAMAEVRAQMNLPAGVNMMADYVSLGSTGSTDPNQANYQLMHTAAQNMASLMAGQAAQVVTTSGSTTTVDVNKFRAMMGSINQQLPQMIAAMPGGNQQNQSMMSQIAANVGTLVTSTAPSGSGMGFRNMSSLFPNMSNVRFWNMSGHLIQGMMGSSSGTGTGMGGSSPSGGTTGGMMGSSKSSSTSVATTGGTTGTGTTGTTGTMMTGSTSTGTSGGATGGSAGTGTVSTTGGMVSGSGTSGGGSGTMMGTSSSSGTSGGSTGRSTGTNGTSGGIMSRS